VVGLVANGAQAASDKPNIVFIFSDDHTAQAVGAYQGHLDYGLELDHSPTPNIDRLAQQGMRFDNAFVANSICKPSRAAVLTGKFGHLNGMKDNKNPNFDNDQLVFTTLLQEAGYETAVIGKWHLGSEPKGFDYYEVLYGQGPYYNPKMRTPNGDVQHEGYVTEIITDEAMDWLKKQEGNDKPFLLMYQHKAPHRNWVPGPDHVNDYAGRDLPEPDTLFYDYSGLATPAHKQDMEIATTMSWGWDLKVRPDQVPRHPKTGKKVKAGEWRSYGRLKSINALTEGQLAWLEQGYKPMNARLHADYASMSEKDLTRWKYQRYIKDYLRVVRGLDDGVGRIMEYLEKSGLKDDTIVIYTSDQGFFLGENGWFDKRWMYEESFRTPLIVRWPGTVEPGSVNKDFVQNIDFGPTMLGMAGLDVPEQMQGRSLTPLLKGQTPEGWRESLYYQYFEFPAVHSVRRHYGVRTERYKLIHYYRMDEWELFDLKKDPEELNSVYGEAAYQDVQKRMKRELRRLQDKYKVPEDIALDDK
jgi:arylsulfatase A-like enzyme